MNFIDVINQRLEKKLYSCQEEKCSQKKGKCWKMFPLKIIDEEIVKKFPFFFPTLTFHFENLVIDYY